MALRGGIPKPEDKRLKAMFFGAAGVGKTTAAIQFPAPYLIDTERGAENDQYVRMLKDRGGALFQTSDFEEMLAEIRSLMTEKHGYRTLIIDPITVVYSDLVDKAASELRAKSKEVGATGQEFGRHIGLADTRMRHLLNLCYRLDMNVIVTAHSKAVYAQGASMEKIGDTFDGYKKLDYVFDLVFEISRRGTERVGRIRKSRVEGFNENDIFPWSYDEIANRYGRETLERSAKVIELASAEDVAELARLVEVLKVESEVVDKWLSKANADSLSDMPADSIVACIKWCRAKIEKVKA
jgi:hypothetical protein